MPTYQILYSVLDHEWIKFAYDWPNNKIVIRIEHRGIFIFDKFDWVIHEDSYNVTRFVYKLLNEINYYLDAIWC